MEFCGVAAHGPALTHRNHSEGALPGPDPPCLIGLTYDGWTSCVSARSVTSKSRTQTGRRAGHTSVVLHPLVNMTVDCMATRIRASTIISSGMMSTLPPPLCNPPPLQMPDRCLNPLVLPRGRGSPGGGGCSGRPRQRSIPPPLCNPPPPWGGGAVAWPRKHRK